MRDTLAAFERDTDWKIAKIPRLIAIVTKRIASRDKQGGSGSRKKDNCQQETSPTTMSRNKAKDLLQTAKASNSLQLNTFGDSASYPFSSSIRRKCGLSSFGRTKTCWPLRRRGNESCIFTGILSSVTQFVDKVDPSLLVINLVCLRTN